MTQDVNERWAAIDRCIVGLSDDELTAHKAAILDEQPEIAPMFADKNPRRSNTLKGMIVDRIERIVGRDGE